MGADADYIKVTNGNNVTIENNPLVVNNATQLQAAINKATEGEYVIALGADIAGNVTINQKTGLDLIIDGKGHNYDGKIQINGNNRQPNTKNIFQNLNFVTNEADLVFIHCNSTIPNDYPHNINIKDCTFKGPGSESNVIPFKAESGRSVTNLRFEDCQAEDVHSFVQGYILSMSCERVQSKGGRGININTSFVSLSFSNCYFEALESDGYALRADCGAEGTINVSNSKLQGYYPICLRSVSSPVTVNFEGNNELDITNSNQPYQVYINNNPDNVTLVNPQGFTNNK